MQSTQLCTCTNGLIRVLARGYAFSELPIIWVCSHAGMIAGMWHSVVLRYCFTCSLSAFVHVGVSGSATRQECLPPPTTAATHGQSLQAVGHPPGNTGYGVLMCTRAKQAMWLLHVL